MTDIHCHILPCVDDGASSLQEACDMASAASKSGVSAIVATPHLNKPRGMYVIYDDVYTASLDELNNALIDQNIPVKVYPGMEILINKDYYELLDGRDIIGINNSSYLLIEFKFGESPLFINRALKDIVSAGYTPVIAHPERYTEVQKQPEIVFGWVENGGVIQVNKGSLLGHFGRHPYFASNRLLEFGIIDVIASDAHDAFRRTADFTEIKKLLSQCCDSSYISIMLDENPDRIVRNAGLVRQD